MLAPSVISYRKSDGDHLLVATNGRLCFQECERPNRVIGRASHSASEGESLPLIPLAPFNPKQVPKDCQEYPVWQAVLRVGQG